MGTNQVYTKQDAIEGMLALNPLSYLIDRQNFDKGIGMVHQGFGRVIAGTASSATKVFHDLSKRVEIDVEKQFLNQIATKIYVKSVDIGGTQQFMQLRPITILATAMDITHWWIVIQTNKDNVWYWAELNISGIVLKNQNLNQKLIITEENQEELHFSQKTIFLRLEKQIRKWKQLKSGFKTVITIMILVLIIANIGPRNCMQNLLSNDFSLSFLLVMTFIFVIFISYIYLCIKQQAFDLFLYIDLCKFQMQDKFM